ncbi:serine/threonine-protein phosphatase 6 regulatory ankyrin repeat subunit B-like [Mytilus trossulus]|uniref:serine/threonine-protein phosphatase 6 regulatory ankyrin repeat subunit B-like n=1 Tax=Mytilus trossulus TaxID=6551 RepID=UPI0030044B3E
MSKKALWESAFSALGSYLTKDSYNFRFIHDALEETVGFNFCTFNPKEMFEDCNILFIRDRVKVSSNVNTDGNFEQNIVILREDDLNEDHVKPLYTRLRTELKRGRFSNLLMSGLCKNRNFVEIFGTHVKTNQGKLKFTGPFMRDSSERNQSNDQSFLKRIFDNASKNEFQDNKDAISRVIEASTNRSNLMNWIVAFGCYEFFTFVWSEMTHLDRKGFLGLDDAYNTDWSPGIKQSPNPFSKSFLPLAILGGSLDIVKTLISDAADVNCFSELFETSLYIAVKLGRYDMVHLLLNHGAQVNLRLWFDMKIQVLVTANNYQLTSLILQYDLNQTKLHKAVRHNDLHILRSNISSDIIDHKTKSGWTVLHYAVLLNNLEASKVLFDDGLSQRDNRLLQRDDRLLQSDDSLLSRRPTPKVNIVDNNGHTALYIAVINNSIEILSLLLRNKAAVNIRDYFNRLPLHYTTSQSVTQLLLTHSSQNKCLPTNENANEIREYGKGPISVFKTASLNITIQTAFRDVCRDCVNMPDNEGNTPLHSVLKRCLIKKENSDCIETLLENGANPCLFNNMGISALELSNCCDTEERYINNIANYKQSLYKTHIVFASATFLFIAFAVGLLMSFPYPYMINKEHHNVIAMDKSQNQIIVYWYK